MSAAESWTIFVAEGGAHAARVHELLSQDAVSPAQLAEVTSALWALEIDAHVVGAADMATLAAALRRALAHASGVDRAAVQAATATLVDAFTELASPDESGARADPARLAAAREALEKGIAPPPLPSRPPPRPPPGASADETRWEPSVDEDMIDPFLDECQERLEGLAQRLVELERTPEDGELVRAIFRDLHTLKGSSAFVGLKKMTRLAHAAEDLVGLVRDGKRVADRPVIDALLASLDVLGAIVQRASARAPIDVDVDAVISRIRGEPTAAALSAPGSAPPPRRSAPPPARGSVPPPPRAADGGGTPALAARTQTLRIEFDKLDLLMNLVGELVLAKGRLGVGLSGLSGLGRELEDQRRHASAHRAGGGARRRSGAVRLEDIATEMGRMQRAFEQVSQEIDASVQGLELVSGQLRDQVMKLRMVPIGRTWSKYHRTVREIANRLGKQVRLELVGGETELDKVLVEQLDDPMLHLVRNAIDHGVERPEARVAAGKTPEGRLRLAAAQRGSQIVIVVEDDGGGIDVERVRAKAVENGLLDRDAAAALDRDSVLELIFRPGFSTASAVSDLSGRGVGMDVVRDTIAQLKGTISIESERGRGTRFELRLPLTLAIIQVLLVRVSGETYAIPIDLVERTIAAPPEAIRIAVGREVLFDGGRDVPVLRLGDLLELPVVPVERPAEVPVVLCDIGGQRWGLVCDSFIGRQEIVVKSLGTLLERVPGAAGATLLGDRCVLILDVPSIVQIALGAGDLAPRERTPSGAFVAASDGRPQRVLVVEDADVIRETIRRTLESAGYDVKVARDGAEGLAIAERETFDLVSTDVVMPNMDGYELTRRLRQLPAYKDIPIIMVTSRADRIDRIRGFDAGVDAYLTKPTDATELLRVIARHLGTRSPPPTD